MTEKNPDKNQTITPAGEVELNEEELDQVTGGKAAFTGEIDKPKTGYTENDTRGKTGGISPKGLKGDGVI